MDGSVDQEGAEATWPGRALQPAGLAAPPLRISLRLPAEPAVEPEGGKRRARSRAGGGQTPRPLSDYQRYGQRRVGRVGVAPAALPGPGDWFSLCTDPLRRV